MSIVTLGLLQHTCVADLETTLRCTLAQADAAAARGAQIICTQELFRSQYFCQSEDYAHFGLAEPIPGRTTELFQELAKRRGVVVIASLSFLGFAFNSLAAAAGRAGLETFYAMLFLLVAGVLGLEAGEIRGLARTGVELAEDPRLRAGEKYETKLHNIFEDAVLLDSAPEGAAAEEEDDEPILLERTPRSAQGGERPE